MSVQAGRITRVNFASVDADPHTATVVSVPVSGISPAVFFAVLPLPIIVVHSELEARIVVPPLFHASAIAFIIADNSGRRTGRAECKRSRTS